MDGIYCHECGTKLDEAPTLLPERRSPCPTCGSLARRFEVSLRGVSATSAHASGELTVSRSATAHAQTAEATGTAYDAEVQVTESDPPTVTGRATGDFGFTGRASGRITDHLVIARRFLRWSQLTERPNVTWLVEVLDESGEVVDSGVGDNQDDTLLAVIDSLRPPDPR